MTGHISAVMNTVVLSPFGGIGVALFLVLSGFGLNESFKSNGLAHYWRKKIARVLIPYFFVATALYYFKWEFAWHTYILDITGLKTHYWFVAFLVKWYIAFWITSKYLLRYRTIILTLLSIIVLFFFPGIEAEQAFSFLAGVLVSIHIDKIMNMRDKKYLQIACVTFLIGTLFLLIKQSPTVRLYMGSWIYSIIQLFIKLPYAIFIICSIRLFPKCETSKFLLLAGTLSYELYLFHMPFFSHLGGSLWLALLLLIASFAICYPFHWFNNKIYRFLS